MIYIMLLSLALLCGCQEEQVHKINDKVTDLANDIIDVGEDFIEDETGIIIDIDLPKDKIEKI